MTIFHQDPALKPGDKLRWPDLDSAGRSLAVAEAALKHQGLTVFVTESAQQAALQSRAIKFFANQKDLPVLVFPDWETLPYDMFSPHQDIISARLQTLAKLPTTDQGILIVPMTTLMHRTAPIDFVSSRTFSYAIGDELDRKKLQDQLSRAGYKRVETVFEHGEFAFRGSIIDIFPMGVKTPFRMDLMDDDIESLRLFDAESQRTLENIEQIELLPAREFPMDKEATNQFLNNWHETFDHDPTKCPVYRDIKEGIAPQGIEYYLSLFFEQTATLFDYLPSNLLLFTDAGIDVAAEQFWSDINYRYDEYSVDPERPILKPNQLFLPVEQAFQEIKKLPRTILQSQEAVLVNAKNRHSICSVPDISVNAKQTNPLIKLEAFLRDDSSHDESLRILFCAESSGRREVLTDLLKTIKVNPIEVSGWDEFLSSTDQYCITTYALDHGLYAPATNVCLITEGELFGQQVMQRRRRSRASESPDYVFQEPRGIKDQCPCGAH